MKSLVASSVGVWMLNNSRITVSNDRAGMDLSLNSVVIMRSCGMRMSKT